MRLACATLGLAVLAGPSGGLGARLASDAVDRMSRTVPLQDIRSLRVEATVGEVTIIGADRPDLTVDIVRHAPRAADFDRFVPVVDASGDVLRIMALQADEARDPRLTADILVRAPATARFEAIRVFEGHVRLSGLQNGCDVDVRRGGIEATALAGRVRLESGIGNIDLRDPGLTPDGMLRLRVFNGSVRVGFNQRPADARILALTFNGTITSDIPLAMRDSFGPRFGETTLGSGNPVVSIDVVTGDIEIRARGR